MRSYSIAIASLAIGAPPKWTDNLLSHNDVPGVVLERRGVARRIPHAALLHLALVRELHAQLRLGVRDALALATELLARHDDVVHRGGHLRVTYDPVSLERAVSARLREALESAPIPRRGRPPRRATASSV